MIVVNVKNHKEGKSVERLAKTLQRIDKSIVMCVPTADIYRVSQESKLTVYAQHVNNYLPGSTTGFVTPQSVKANGARGTLLNHSEHRVPFAALEQIMVKCHEAKLKMIVCVEGLHEAKKVLRYVKYKKIPLQAIAYEDRGLIGSGKSITEYKAKNVEKFAAWMRAHAKGVKVLCGAGISSIKDVEAAKKLGCHGVLVASAITKAKNPKRFFSQEGKMKEIRQQVV